MAKILLTEDNAVNVDTFSQRLASKGWRNISKRAYHGEEWTWEIGFVKGCVARETLPGNEGPR